MKMLVALCALAVCLPPSAVWADSQADAEATEAIRRYLVEGKLEEGEQYLSALLEQTPDHSVGQYGLGIIRVLRAVENLAQNFYQHGLYSNVRQIPFVRLPVPENPEPQHLDYARFREILLAFIADLDKAAGTLAEVTDPQVKLTIPVGLIRLDLNNDGAASDKETFWRVFTAVAWRAAKLDDSQREFPIAFDAADVHWIIGYTHLLRAMTEAWLAYDTEDFFQATASFFFAGASSPYDGLRSGRPDQPAWEREPLADLIAVIHLAHFDVYEPQRMSRAREHLLAMIEQSRQCWKHALAETDDDREWIPNAQQTSLTPLTVTQERIDGWKRFLDEAESVLEGKTLLPHWRIEDGWGINLKRFFEEPRTFDLVMWGHGAAALPYLEKGPRVQPETVSTLSRIFQGRFVVFAIWFQ